MVWLRLMEVWLTTRLLQSPSFHRAVRVVHKKVNELQHGKDPADMGGTNIDKADGPETKRFFKYFLEELKHQFRGNPSSRK